MVSLSVFSLRVLRFFFLSRFLYFVPSSSLLLMFVLFGFACGFNFSGIPRWVPWVFSKEPSGEVGNPRSQNPLSIGLRRRLACIPISCTSLSISPRFSLFSHLFFSFSYMGFFCWFGFCFLPIALWSLIYIWVICQTQLIHVTIMNCNLNFVQIDIYAFEMRYHRQSSLWVTSR